MTKLAATALRADFANTLNRVAFQGERVALERHGKTIAGLVSAEDLAFLEAVEDRADLRAVRRALKEGGRPIPLAKVKAELGL